MILKILFKVKNKIGLDLSFNQRPSFTYQQWQQYMRKIEDNPLNNHSNP